MPNANNRDILMAGIGARNPKPSICYRGMVSREARKMITVREELKREVKEGRPPIDTKEDKIERRIKATKRHKKERTNRG